MKMLLFNGSPRKTFNTAKLLEEVKRAAEEEGVETEWINLYDYEYRGCYSCFACKRKKAKFNGLCVIRDGMHPLLEKTKDADILVFGSPVYLSAPAAQLSAFTERLLFPLTPYEYDEKLGRKVRYQHKVIPSAMIYTMNCSEEYFEKIDYPAKLAPIPEALSAVYQDCEVLYAYNTYQFDNYDLYNASMFNEEQKRKYRDEHFPKDQQNAYDLGKRLIEKARKIKQDQA